MTAERLSQTKSAGMAAGFRLRLVHILSATFVCGPVLAAIAPLGLAPLFTIAAAGTVAIHIAQHRAWPWPARWVTIIGAAFAAWTLLTALWTVAVPETIHFLPRAAFYILGGLAFVGATGTMSAEERRIADVWLIGGVLFGTLLFAIEIVTQGGIETALHSLQGKPFIFGEGAPLNRGAAFFAVFAFPAAIAARRRFGWIAAVAVLAAVLAVCFPVHGTKQALGALAGLTVLAVGAAWGRWATNLLAAAIVLVIVTAPLQPVILAAVPGPWTTSHAPSISHRMIIWRFVGEKIAERPLLGWGLNSSRAIPGGKEETKPGTENLPLHPHNVPLQLWLEFGGIGALIAAAGLAAAIAGIGRLFRDRVELGFAAAAVTVATLEAAVGYGMWQGWWQGMVWIAAATITALAPAAPDRRTTT